MKKIISILLVLASLFAFSSVMASCGSSSPNSSIEDLVDCYVSLFNDYDDAKVEAMISEEITRGFCKTSNKVYTNFMNDLKSKFKNYSDRLKEKTGNKKITYKITETKERSIDIEARDVGDVVQDVEAQFFVRVDLFADGELFDDHRIDVIKYKGKYYFGHGDLYD